MAPRSRAASTSPRRLLLITGDGPPDWATIRFLGLVTVLPSMRRVTQRQPLPAVAGQQLVGGCGPGRAGGVSLRRRRVGPLHRLNNRIHDLPGALDLVAAHEQG